MEFITLKYETVKNGIYQTGTIQITKEEYLKLINEEEKHECASLQKERKFNGVYCTSKRPTKIHSGNV